MDQKAKEEARKAANKRFHEKQKSQYTYCVECNKQIKNSTLRSHNVTKKHLQNLCKERKPFFEEMIDLWNQCGVEGADIRKLCIQMHDLIEGEYFDENHQEIIPEEERYNDPLPFARNEVERDLCGTVGWMEKEIYCLLDHLHRNKPSHVHVEYLEKKEAKFDSIRKDVDDRDLKKKLLWCFQDLSLPWPADKTEEERQKKLEMWRKQEKEQEERLKERAAAYSSAAPKPSKIIVEEEMDREVVEDFPAYAAFLKMNDKSKLAVLENICLNLLHVYEDEPTAPIMDTVEFQRSGDYNEIYRYALYKYNDYNERQGMDCGSEDDISTSGQEENEDGNMDLDM